QRGLRNVRTDLDAFSPVEVTCLISHGYTVARQRLVENNLLADTTSAFIWNPLALVRMSTRLELNEIRKSSRRKLRLWSFRDWVSWVSAFVVGIICVVAVLPIYLRQQELIDAAMVADLKLDRLGQVLPSPSGRGLAVSPDGRMIAVVNSDGSTSVRDIQ